jgi:multiple antibiotic resistance protein
VGSFSRALLLTAGIVLFLVALDVVMRQYSAPEHAEEKAVSSASSPRRSPRALAFSPLAFPTIITPYGAAVLILFVSLRAGQTAVVLEVIGLTALVLALDLAAMLTANRILTTPGVAPTLGILGSVLSILQVALGVQAMIDALRLLGVPGLASP